MNHIGIKNFDNYQHYKERNITSWIKLYYAILDDYKINELLENERWVFIGLILLAGKYDNKIPFDIKFLKKKICHDSTSESKLESILKKMVGLDLVYTESRQTLDAVYTESTPIREDKIRVEEIRIDKNREDSKHKEVYSSFKNVYLTTDEHQKLSSRFGSSLVDRLESLGSYIASHGAERKYKSHYATIIQWSLKDEKKSTPTMVQFPRLNIDAIPRAQNQFDPGVDCLVNGCNGKINMNSRKCSKCNTDEYQSVNTGIKIKLKTV